MKPNILLVEDNDVNADMLTRRLVRRGFDVFRSTNGTQAIELARSEKPDLILMDISLPGIDGWEATRRLRADAETARIPVIALTAHALPVDRQRSLDAGCDEYETKPIDLTALVDKMMALLGVPEPR